MTVFTRQCALDQAGFQAARLGLIVAEGSTLQAEYLTEQGAEFFFVEGGGYCIISFVPVRNPEQRSRAFVYVLVGRPTYRRKLFAVMETDIIVPTFCVLVIH